jgi:large subunit ribosomal protein L9
VKVVLREHVDHLGERGEIVAVAAGYARNYLLPKGLALEATPGNLKQIEHQRRIWRVREAKELGEAREVVARLAQVELTATRKAGESGTLYGSVTNQDVAELLAAEGFGVERRRILLAEPIKAIGDYEVGVRLHREVTGKVRLKVVSDEA